jgi:hypothetical protein
MHRCRRNRETFEAAWMLFNFLPGKIRCFLHKTIIYTLFTAMTIDGGCPIWYDKNIPNPSSGKEEAI